MKYKYLHVFNSPDFKFIPKILAAFNDYKDELESENHLFITPHKKVYELIKEYPNTKFVESSGAEIVNQYSKTAKWIIIHSFFKPSDALMIKKSVAKKVIWRTWGHDLYRNNHKGSVLKRVAKEIRESLVARKIAQFYAVAGDNIIDEYNISLGMKNKQFFRLPYVYEKDSLSYFCKPERDDKYRIMIGHSGDPNNNHIDIMKKLFPYLNDSITIVLVLAYTIGDSDYVESVKKFALDNIPNNVEIIDNFMPYMEYVHFLSTIDIAVFDSPNSYALGNISVLARLEKTLYLNQNGVIHHVFAQIGLPHFCKSELLVLNEEKRPKLLSYNSEEYPNVTALDDVAFVEKWKYFLETIEQ